MVQITLIETMFLMLSLRARMIVRDKCFYRSLTTKPIKLSKIVVKYTIFQWVWVFLDIYISTNHFLKEEVGSWVWYWGFFPPEEFIFKFSQAQGWFGVSGTFAFHLQPESEHLSFGKEKHLSLKLSYLWKRLVL